MPKRSGQKTGRKSLELIRVRAVEQVLAGGNPDAVIRGLGFSRGCVYEWLRKFRQGGWAALKSKQISGRPHRLTEVQQASVYEKVVQNVPLELGLNSALWTRALLAAFIRDQFQIQLSRASVGRLLHEFGLISEHPCRRARELNPAAMAVWRRKDYEQIRLLARHARAEIAFLDVARADGRIHAKPIDSKPRKSPPGARLDTELLSAFSPNGQIRFMAASAPPTADLFARFLHRLMDGRKRSLFLIVPEGFVQYDLAVQKCVAAFVGRLRLFTMPLPLPVASPVREQPAPSPTRIAASEPRREAAPLPAPAPTLVVPPANPATLWPSLVRPGGVSS